MVSGAETPYARRLPVPLRARRTATGAVAFHSCRTECVSVLQNCADGSTPAIDVPLMRPQSRLPLVSR